MDDWLTVTEAMQRLKCSRETLRRYIKEGRLRAYRLGGKRNLRFQAEDIEKLLQPMETKASFSFRVIQGKRADQQALIERMLKLREKIGPLLVTAQEMIREDRER